MKLIVEPTNQTVVDAFQRAAREVPGYRDILRRHGVHPQLVTDYATFRSRVPVLDKAAVFGRYPASALYRMSDVRSIQSGHGAFRITSWAGHRTLDDILQHAVQAFERRTLLINTYPTSVDTALAVAETGGSLDAAITILRRFAPHYDQVVLLGLPIVLKALLERPGIEWTRYRTSLLADGDTFCESWRRYARQFLGPHAFIGCALGVPEIDPYLFYESQEGRLTWDPRSIWVEVFDSGCIAVSMLSPRAATPLFRYQTGHVGRLDGGFLTLDKTEADHVRDDVLRHASFVTGAFRLSDAVAIQLRPGIRATAALRQRLEDSLARPVRLCSFRSRLK